jgi:hypothetical protein
VIQGTFGVIQGTFGVIQGTFGVIQVGAQREWEKSQCSLLRGRWRSYFYQAQNEIEMSRKKSGIDAFIEAS